MTGLMGLALFLGGHNPRVQAFIAEALPAILQYFTLMHDLFLTSKLRKDKIAFSKKAAQLQVPADYPHAGMAAGTLPAVLRVIANLVHLNPAVCEHIPQSTVLQMMECTGLAPDQPLMREWALLAVRHACEVSPRVRECLASLQVEVQSQQ